MRAAILSAAFFLAAFGLNLSTLSPAVHPDDSPETVTAGATLSIQHPPGYPLHSILGRLAVLSLPGGAAFRVNLLSALMGALGLLLFAHGLRLAAEALAGRDLPLLPALAASLILACSYSLWFQSSIAKGGIYTLNFALSQATLLGLLKARVSPKPRPWLRLAALSFGLGMANHWTSQVVLLPGYALLMIEPWWHAGRPRPNLRLASEMALLTALGLSLYLFLPLRSAQGPVMSWGEPYTLKGFLWVFMRGQYAAIESSKSLDAFMALLKRMGTDLSFEFHPLGLVALAAAWILAVIKKPWLSLSLLSLPLTLALAVAIKANPPADSLWVIDPYLLPLYSGLAMGLAAVLAWLPAAAAACAAAALALGIWHFPQADQSRNYLGYDYAQNLFLSAPKGSLLFCEGDSNTALPYYAREVLGKRQDLAPVALVLSGYAWYMDGLQRRHPWIKLPITPLSPPANLDWISAANPEHPAILSNSYTQNWADPSRVLPRGLVNRFLPKGKPLAGPAKLALLRSNRIWEAYSLRGAFAPAVAMDPLSVRLVRDNYRDVPARLATALMEAGDRKGAEAEFVHLGKLVRAWSAPWIQAGNCAYFSGDHAGAEVHWRRALAEEPASAEAIANLGLLQFERKDFAGALESARKALKLNPGLANATDLAAKSEAALSGRSAGPSPQALAAASLGDREAQAGRAEASLKAYAEAMRLGYVSAGIHRNRAVMYSRLDKNPEAIQAMRQALALEPASSELHKYLGIMLLSSGQAKAALPELQEALRLNPGDAQLPGIIATAQKAP